MSDAELLARAGAGEASALGVLYDRYAPPLLRFARRLEPHEAEDLLHATFLRVTQIASRFESRGPSARAWLFAIMSRVAQERSRALRRFSRALSRLSEMPRHRATYTLETAPDLERAIVRLSTAKRTVLLLAEVEGFTCEEIAEMLGVPVGTVWTRLHHARKELRAFDREDES
ncbi:MAG TPA: RNA polymerase sigma factor [Polyangiales bacterium]|nr:RNA polymerase sigma factor [Polyangiales bacterium]